jgi:microcystin-dependent protein
MPAHTHLAVGSSTPANLGIPTGNLWAAGNDAYSPGANTSMSPGCVQSAGGSQAHQNLSPCLAATFCIALQGIFPSRS